VTRDIHVETAIQIYGQLEVVAVAFVLSVPLSPEVADGRTLEAGVHEESYAVGKQCCNDRPANVREPRRNRFGEDPEV
jgi:hypothetical protein